MEYLSIRQTSERWGISPRRIQVLCAHERILGAVKIGYSWAIPADASKPADERIKSGKYIQKSTIEKVPWDLEEAVALFDLYFKNGSQLKVPSEEIAKLSKAYKKRANVLGLETDEKFRNIAGLKMQLGCIHYVITDGEAGLSNVSSLFYQTYELYRTAPERFNLILQSFIDKYAG